MEKKPQRKGEQPLDYSPLPLWFEGLAGKFDPLGSYTGITMNPEEKPVQDADDL